MKVEPHARAGGSSRFTAWHHNNAVWLERAVPQASDVLTDDITTMMQKEALRKLGRGSLKVKWYGRAAAG